MQVLQHDMIALDGPAIIQEYIIKYIQSFLRKSVHYLTVRSIILLPAYFRSHRRQTKCKSASNMQVFPLSLRFSFISQFSCLREVMQWAFIFGFDSDPVIRRTFEDVNTFAKDV